VALGHQKTFTVTRICNGELDLFAAVRQDILLGGDKLEPLGLQAGNERTERGNCPVDFLNSKFLEDCGGNVRAYTLGGAALVHITVRHFIGCRSTNKARTLEIVNGDSL